MQCTILMHEEEGEGEEKEEEEEGEEEEFLQMVVPRAPVLH